MSVEIVYETHSVTTGNEAGIATGWPPGQLSEQGRLDKVAGSVAAQPGGHVDLVALAVGQAPLISRTVTPEYRRSTLRRKLPYLTVV